MKKPSKYWILAGTFFTSVSSIIIRFSESPSLVIAAYRMLFTSIMLFFPVYIKYGSEFKSLNKNDCLLCLISGIFLALHFASWIQSIQMTTIANSTILVSCSPIFVAAINYFLLKERITGKMIVGIGMSLIGTVIIGIGSSQGNGTAMILGNVLAFMGAVFVAGYLVIGGIVRKTVSAGVYVLIVYSVSAIALFFMCFASGTPVYPYPLKEFALFFLLAFFSSILGHTVYNYLMKYYSSTLISITTLMEPVFASLMAMIIFKEIPSAYTVLGGIIIIGGIYLGTYFSQEKPAGDGS
ncbi:MAG TPA: DMT family transporter [Sedimentibacter sp.]|nr:DMT family transporter [Sedimentibacter sp.]HNZ82574.1 DMT family transporter [Sedimentibacter sp.]HQB63259.1 DMT family transporter [Sedimentibacter sp.]